MTTASYASQKTCMNNVLQNIKEKENLNNILFKGILRNFISRKCH